MHVGVVEAGHDKTSLHLHGLRTLFAAATIQKNVFDAADAADFASGYAHGRSPRMLRIVGIDAAMQVVNRFWRGFVGLRQQRHSCDANERDDRSERNKPKDPGAARNHLDFPSTTPETPSR